MLEKLAKEYYELMNKINTTVKYEKEDLAEGAVSEYEKGYKELVTQRDSEIKEITKNFNERVVKLKGLKAKE